MELIRNVRCDDDGQEIVEIDSLDIENFNINRSDVPVQITSHNNGNLFGRLNC